MSAAELCGATWPTDGPEHECSMPKGHFGAHGCGACGARVERGKAYPPAPAPLVVDNREALEAAIRAWGDREPDLSNHRDATVKLTEFLLSSGVVEERATVEAQTREAVLAPFRAELANWHTAPTGRVDLEGKRLKALIAAAAIRGGGSRG